MARTPLLLPDFPWDSLAPLAARAQEHGGGMIDLSIGSPVDATPAVIRNALVEATDAHAYPQTAGSPQLRHAIVDWFARRRSVADLSIAQVLPTVGSKEFIALLPRFLGLNGGDVVVIPEVAYPTYAIGAALAGARVFASNDPTRWPENTRLVWLNSPGNPDGRVLSIDELRAAVRRARELGAVIVNDECYAELNWAGPDPTPCILDPRVVDADSGDIANTDTSSVLAVYSLSKQSNLAGYRAGFVAGSQDIIAELLEVRRHAGLIVSAPVQAAMVAALSDDAHVDAQRELYRARRTRLVRGLEAAGFRIDASDAGLYVWATRGEDAWHSMAQLADLGILAAPGSFYAEAPATHVRFALTATDAMIADAEHRLTRTT